jgi:hypothetical protein
MSDVIYSKVNVNTLQPIITMYSITVMPTFSFFKHDKLNTKAVIADFDQDPCCSCYSKDFTIIIQIFYIQLLFTQTIM